MGSRILRISPSIEFSYSDSGPPPSTRNERYTTIFAVHGFMFGSRIFYKMMSLAPNHRSGVRLVAIDRRNYGGSTPYTDDEIRMIGSDVGDEKMKVWERIGHELASFVDGFVRENDLPAFSADDRSGGVVILAWSLGCAFALSAVAFVASLEADVKRRLSDCLKSFILLEPPDVALGFAPRFYNPLYDPSVPEPERKRLFTIWSTSFFDHASITSHKDEDLTHASPSPHRVPTIYRMSEEEQRRIVHLDSDATARDLMTLDHAGSSLREVYTRACYDDEVRAQCLPGMKMCMVVGGSTTSNCFLAKWGVEEDDRARGGGYVRQRVVEGWNHAAMWEEPEKLLEVCVELAG